MPFSRRARLLALALLATLPLTACAGTQSAGSDGVIVMTVAAPTVSDFDDYVARTKGFYDKRGITVRRVQTGTAAQSVQLLATGDVEVGRGLSNTVQARVRTSGRLDFIDVADTTIRPPYVMTSKGIPDFAGLANTSIGITSITDQGTTVTEQLIHRKGPERSSVEFLPTGGTGSRLAAMNAGGISATLLLPPVNFKAEKQGAVRLGYVPVLLGRDYYFSFTGIVVRESWAKRNREDLVRYLAARDDALRWLHNPANAEEAAQILATATETPLASARKTYELLFRSPVAAFADRIGVSKPAGAGVLNGLRLSGLLRDDTAKIEDFVDDSYAAQARELTQ